MENTAEIEENESKPRGKCGFWGWFVIIIRSLFILLFVVILLGGLYFKAPWKILVLDAVLLALLTVVPKKKRKYGWLAIAIAVLAVTVWIFLPQKDTGEWKPYTFDEELAVLEAERAVPAEDNAAPLYEVLFEQWEQIKETDPFPDEMDTGCGREQPAWTTEEFSETAAWYKRHEDFFDDLVTATQKPACFFPAEATTLGLLKTMDRRSPIRRFAQHLIRASYLDIGENRKGAWEKQMAVLNLGNHIHQQPLLIELLVSISLESLAFQANTETLVNDNTFSGLTADDYLKVTAPIRTSHFDHSKKWQQILAYEKLLVKNVLGMFYEVNPEGKIRFSRPQTLIGIVQDISPNEQLCDLRNSYWAGVSWKISRAFMWAAGLPKDPVVISEWADEAYTPLEKTLEEEQLDFEDIQGGGLTSLELNYKYILRQMIQLALPSFKKINDEILPRVDRQKRGTEIVCDLVLYKKQHGQYPNTLDELEFSDEEKRTVSDIYSGFMYQKIKNDFLLYHIGSNGIDEKGLRDSRRCGSASEDSRCEKEQPADDILIWPRNEDARKQMLGIEESDEAKEEMVPMMIPGAIN
jgi:hypothetical protein